MSDFYNTYIALRDVILRAAPQMKVAKDVQGDITLNVPPAHIMDSKDPVWFGSVRMGKTFVSYYLMPLSQSALYNQVPDSLKKYMQGRTCFNLHNADPAVMAELEKITKIAAEAAHAFVK